MVEVVLGSTGTDAPQPQALQLSTAAGFSMFKAGPLLPPHSHSHSVAATAAALSLGHLLLRRTVSRRHLHLAGLHIHHHFKNIIHLTHEPGLKNIRNERIVQFGKSTFLLLSTAVISSSYSSCLKFLNGDGTSKDPGETGTSSLNTSRGSSSSGRQWTNIILGANVGIFVIDALTQWRLLCWGAKINCLIDKGQVWRLVTSAFLHANFMHLMANCYSLDSVGPTLEKNLGPGKYLSVYFTSAIAGSAMSYKFNKSSSVGASGALFGLIGSLAVFVSRHKEMFGGGNEYLQKIASVIAINVVIGLLVKRIDNWGHLGGFVGGTVISWLVGPAWKYESMSSDGQRIFVDRAPIFHLIDRKKAPRAIMSTPTHMPKKFE